MSLSKTLQRFFSILWLQGNSSIYFFCHVAIANRAPSTPEESSHFAVKSLTFNHSSDPGPKAFVTT
jgi:hypothetical protein